MSPAPAAPGAALASVCAVPQPVANAYNSARMECAPGHTFNLFSKLWDPKNWSANADAGKTEALKAVRLPQDSATMLAAAVDRQASIFAGIAPEQALAVHATTTSPFATGLGNEHPIENGFAFLSPYGLPYLAGSGVKGVLRKAAESTADAGGERKPEWIELLFGTENQANDSADAEPVNLRRGALTFWDVFPTPRPSQASDKGDPPLFRVEIMTPHHSGYLQGGKTPNDSEQPNPIPFLAIEPGAGFQFIVTCQTHRLKDGSLPRPWKQMVESLFEDAFAWLGFGAKTAVGYGAMKKRIDAAGEKPGEAPRQAVAQKNSWVEEAMAEVRRKPGVAAADALYGRMLAQAWSGIRDEDEKAAARADIKRQWGAAWNEKLTGARKKAREIYGDDPS